MNRGFYSKLLTQYRTFFQTHYDEESPFNAKVVLKRDKNLVKFSMITENDRNELGDVASVDTKSAAGFNYKDVDKRYKMKVEENKLSGLYAITPDKTTSYYREYEHEFGVEAAFEPKVLWQFYGNDKWNLFANAKYNDVCFNTLKVGYEGNTPEENKQEALKPNRIQFNNATIFQNGFFFGGNLNFLIPEKKAECFEKLLGYGDEKKLIFAKHTSKGFVNEDGQIEAGALAINDNREYKEEMGVGVNYTLATKESVVTAGYGRQYKESLVNVKGKVENTTAFVALSFNVTDRVRLNLSDSINIVNYAKNPKDGDSHKYKMGISLVYTDEF